MTQHPSASARIPVSTVLLTRNSAKTLPQYFEAMQEIDDIMLMDGGSTDETLELAKKYPNVRVFPQPKEFLDGDGRIVDFSGVRNAGYRLAKHRWILCIDADETPTEELLTALRQIVKEGKPGVYYVHRVFTLRGKPIVSFSGSSSDHVRLFHLDCVRGCIKPVHERLDIIPGSPKISLPIEVIVPLSEDSSGVRAKFDRYLQIETKYWGNITFKRWLRWSLLRNAISIPRMTVVYFFTYLIPKRGPRYPFRLYWEQVRYLWVLTWRLCPVGRR
jgi:glycosyltransferase involved in cell wall biosynthesis